MRRFIDLIVVLAGGLIISYTILSLRGIFSPFWNITFGAIIAGASFIFSNLLSLYPPASGNLSRRTVKVLCSIAIVIIIDIALLIISWIIPTPTVLPIPYCSHVWQEHTAPLAIKGGIGVTQTADGEFIGISDGSFAFDTGTANNDRTDTTMKCEAAEQFAKGDQQAEQSLHNAIQEETNDAEDLIYQQNQAIQASGAPYVTLVVATMLTGDDQGKIGVGRDTLQGVYTAQHEYNNPNAEHTLPNNLKVRILIANAGSNPAYVSLVAQQIIRLSNSDHTFIGVVGWNFSAYAKLEIPLLNSAKIPMILPTASEDHLISALSPYAFRITPTSKKEAIIGAHYINTHLHSRHVLLFVDNNDAFSSNLAMDFVAAYGYQNIVSTQTYRVGDPTTLRDKLAQLLIQYNPDLIYFAGYPNDLITLLNQFSSTGPYASLKVMGGDSLYEVNVHYPPNTYRHLLFTAAAFPDVWINKGLPAPVFFSEFIQNFDPNNNHPGAYGWSRPDADAILNYDASLALLNGCANALSGQTSSFQPTLLAVQQGLNNVSPFQGASGLISFQDDDGSNPSVNKVIIMLTVDQNEKTQIEQVYGCLTRDHCY